MVSNVVGMVLGMRSVTWLVWFLVCIVVSPVIGTVLGMWSVTWLVWFLVPRYDSSGSFTHFDGYFNPPGF